MSRLTARRFAALVASALLTCVLLVIPGAPAAATPSRGGRYDALDAYVRDRMTATGTPGLAYAVVGPQGPLHRRSFGTDGRGAPVTPATPFLWGSIAKPILATVVMTLVQQHRLELDDPVVKYLPAFGFGGAGHASRVTIRQLLGHRAGIPESATAALTDCFGSHCAPPAQRIRALDRVRPLGAPGSTYAYTSVDYLVLTAVIEAVTGERYADHLSSAVFDPAGMDGAIADRASARDQRLAPGHQPLWGHPAAIADGIDDDGAGYGYVGGSLDDLAAFAALQLRSGTASGSALLSRDSIAAMRRPGTLRPSGRRTDYGLGWRLGGLGPSLGHAVWHTGGTPGYSAMLFVLPQRHLALVIEQNLYGILQDQAIMQVGFGAVRLLTGRQPPEPASDTSYLLVIWTTSAIALSFLLAAAYAASRLRRPLAGRSPRRRIVASTLSGLTGLAPGVVLALVAAQTGLRPMVTWLPDVFVAASVAAAAGILTAGLRLAAELRRPRPLIPGVSRPPCRETPENW